MSNEFISYDDAISELSLAKDELNELVSKGELRAFREGDDLRFKRDDILAMKKSRETEPTIVLSDTAPEAISLGGDEQPIDLDSISTDETVLNIEGLLEDETEGTTPIPGTADISIDDGLGEDTVLDTEGLDLDSDFDLSEDDTLLADGDDTLLVGAGQTRQVQMVKKQAHGFMTALMAFTMLLMLLPCATLMNLMVGRDGSYPEWGESLTLLNPVVEAVVGLFRG